MVNSRDESQDGDHDLVLMIPPDSAELRHRFRELVAALGVPTEQAQAVASTRFVSGRQALVPWQRREAASSAVELPAVLMSGLELTMARRMAERFLREGLVVTVRSPTGKILVPESARFLRWFFDSRWVFALKLALSVFLIHSAVVTLMWSTLAQGAFATLCAALFLMIAWGGRRRSIG